MDAKLATYDDSLTQVADDLDGFSLPGWIYRHADFLIREIAYAHPDPRREMKVARYLNWRVNRRVSVEDKALIERVQAGMGSRSYAPGPLGGSEVALRSFGRRMRELIPESRLNRAPGPGWRTGRKSP